MPERLLKPLPMIAIETCATCGREHADALGFRRCSVCGGVFCWDEGPGQPNMAGAENRRCGCRRDVSSEADDRRRIEYRCRAHATRSWLLFGADWAVMRPIAVYVLLAVGFSMAFWGLIFGLVTAWLHERGFG